MLESLKSLELRRKMCLDYVPKVLGKVDHLPVKWLDSERIGTGGTEADNET